MEAIRESQIVNLTDECSHKRKYECQVTLTQSQF